MLCASNSSALFIKGLGQVRLGVWPAGSSPTEPATRGLIVPGEWFLRRQKTEGGASEWRAQLGHRRALLRDAAARGGEAGSGALGTRAARGARTARRGAAPEGEGAGGCSPRLHRLVPPGRGSRVQLAAKAAAARALHQSPRPMALGAPLRVPASRGGSGRRPTLRWQPSLGAPPRLRPRVLGLRQPRPGSRGSLPALGPRLPRPRRTTRRRTVRPFAARPSWPESVGARTRRLGVDAGIRRRAVEDEHPDEEWRERRGAYPSPTAHLSAGSLVLWRGFSKASLHMGRLRNAKIHVERAIKVGGSLGV